MYQLTVSKRLLAHLDRQQTSPENKTSIATFIMEQLRRVMGKSFPLGKSESHSTQK